MTVPCPNCGGQVVGRKTPDEVKNLVTFSPSEAEIFNYLAERFGRPILVSDVGDFLYRRDSNGGPDNPLNVVRQICYRLRRKLHPLGLTIKHAGYGFITMRWL